MAVKKITGDDVSELNAAPVAFLDVSATWCGPCKAIAPVVDELSESPDFAGRIEFFNADAEENRALTKKLRIRSIPNLLIIKEGKVTAQTAGFQSAEELKAWIESNI